MSDINIGELAATTIESRTGKLADNVTNHIPLLFEIFEKGNIMPATGGSTIRQELEYGENSTSKWYSGLEVLDVSGSDVFDAADFAWKQYNANMVISGLDEIINNGKEQVINLVTARIKNLEKTAKNEIGRACMSDGTGSDGKEIGGLQFLVADSPTTGIVGGIDRSAQTFWRNQTYDFSSEAGAAASATNIQTGMNQLHRRCTRNADKPNAIIMDDNYYGFYESSLQSIQRLTDERRGNLGFETIAYKGVPVYFDDNCPASHMYLLNTNYLHYRPSSVRNFKVDKESARKPVSQDTYVVPIYWAGNLTLSNGSLQGVGKE